MYLYHANFKDMIKVIKIPLSKDKFALIDEIDYPIVSQFNWYARKGKRGVYYATSRQHKNIHMHRLILDITDSKTFVDHKNNDGLDNTRNNIRIATCLQNNLNKRPYKNRSSEFKGVYWSKEKKKWVSQIKKAGCKTKHIGYFVSEIHAAIAYNTAARECHGEFAFINPVPSA